MNKRVKEQEWKVVGYKDGYDEGDQSEGIATHKVYLKNISEQEITAFVKVHHYSSSRLFGPDFMDITRIDYQPKCPWGCKQGLNLLVASKIKSELDNGSLIIQDDVNSF